VDESEETLLLEMCSDDPEQAKDALRSFFERHASGLEAAIRNVLITHGIRANLDEMAEEILHDVVVIVARKAANDDLLKANSPKLYVYGTARRHTLRYLRDGKRRRTMEGADIPFWEATDELLGREKAADLDGDKLRQDILECMEALEGKQKDYMIILAQHVEEPLKLKGLAHTLGVSAVSVRNRVHEARHNVANCLEKKGHPNPLRAKGGRV